MGFVDPVWYNVVQPERFEVQNDDFTWIGGNARNILCTDFDELTITLSTDVTKVPRGSSVRVFNFDGDTILVKVGGSNLSVIDAADRYSEFLFYVDESDDPHWVVLADNQPSGRLP